MLVIFLDVGLNITKQMPMSVIRYVVPSLAVN